MSKQNESNNSNSIKFILMILSVMVIIISLTGGIIVTDKGRATLFTFESFYVYIISMVVAFYKVLNNKNPNTPIIVALLSYFYTSFLVWQMFKYVTDIELHLGIHFYIYLSSSIFLLISLLFNDRKKVVNLNNELKNSMNSNSNLSEQDFLFTNFVYGFKEISYNTAVLLVNNIPNNSLDLVYKLNNNNQSKILPFDKIKNISYSSKVRTSGINKEGEDNEMKSALLSAAMFGGSPIMQLVGSNGFNLLFDSISNDYDKVKFNVEFEITIEVLIENEDKKLVFISEINPEFFIKNIKK